MHSTKLSRALPLAAALALASPALAAQDGATDLDEVQVTATRTETALADTLAPAQVITREEIERSQARSLPDLLRGRAGIGIANQGGTGKLSSVFLRGSESDHVLVLVDGVRIGSNTDGAAAFQDLPVEQIDRIEIVRGPRSSLYGSNAIGGVIQIFTRRDSGKVAPRMRAGIGSHGLRETSAGLGGRVGRGWFSADAAHQRTDGIDACRGRGPSGEPFDFGAGCFTDEPDRDGYRNRSLRLRGGVGLGEALTLEATALRAESDNEFDGSAFAGNEAENVQQAVGAMLAFSSSSAFALTLRAGRSDDESDNHYAADGVRTFANFFHSRRDSASAQADLALAAGHTLTLGSDWQDERVDSSTVFDVASRDNIAGFLAYQGALGTHRIEASVRSDDNEQFDSHATGHLGWGTTVGERWRVTASAGTGFRAPSFNDLYFPFFGNPDLRPEESESLNAGIARAGDVWRLQLDVYETRVDDLIAFDAALSLPNNVERARIRGAELTLAGTLAGWDVSTQLSHVDPRNRTDGANRDRLLARRARNSGRIDLDRAFGVFRFGTTLNGASARYDDVANSVRIGGHATLDLRLEYALSADWTLQAGASNVFDRAYETVAWYPQPGREYGLSVRYSPTR